MKARTHTIKASVLVAFISLTLLVGTQSPAQVGPGSALSFDGVDDWVDMQSAVIPTSGDFTVECWMWCPAAPNSFREILAQGSSGNAFYLGTSSANKLRVGDTWGTTADFPVGGWHHLAVVKSSTNTLVYLDGASWLSKGSAVANPAASPGFRLGRQYGSIGEYWPGQVDEVRIWNVARSPAQIQTNLSRALTGTEAGLVAYWRCDESSGSTLGDATGNGHAGTLSNGVSWVTSGVPFLPEATAGAATDVVGTKATLNGLIYPGNLGICAWFEWGTTTNYGSATPGTIIHPYNTNQPVSFRLSDLAIGQAYHYRLVATNPAVTTVSGDASFTTLADRVTNIVTTLSDPGGGSLREAITSGADAIVLVTNGTIILTGGELVLAESFTITGPGAQNLAISGNLSNRIFNVAYGATVNISGLTLRDGKAPDGPSYYGNHSGNPGLSGGAIYSAGVLNLTGCVFTNCAAGNGDGHTGSLGGSGGAGGAVFNVGSLTAEACTFTGNRAGAGGFGGFYEMWGGVVLSCPGGFGGAGGAIYSAGPAALSHCTISGNTGGTGGLGSSRSGMIPPLGGVGGAGGAGGGIYNSNILSLTASTVCSNSTGQGGVGGPGHSGGPGGSGGGVFNGSNATATVWNTLVAQNLIGPLGAAGEGGPPTPTNGFGPDVCGDFISQGHNLVGAGDGSTGFGIADIVGTNATPLDPQLQPLAGNGGPTWTHALSGFSPALDAGDDTLTSLQPLDQRGQPRLCGAHVDIGAFEMIYGPPLFGGLQAVVGTNSLITGAVEVAFNGTLNPGGLNGIAWIQFGLTTNYGGASPLCQISTANNPVPYSVNQVGLASGVAYHYRPVMTNRTGVFHGPDQTFAVPSMFLGGDLDGDGAVDTSEMRTVAHNFWATSPPQVTGLTTVGPGAFQYCLSNAVGLDFSVFASTNLVDWLMLSNVVPRLQFTDPDAAKYPERFYRLRWP